VAIAEQHLRAVCATTGHTGYIAVLDGCEQVVLRFVPGTNPLQVVSPPGVRTPAFATSNGRAMLARLSDADIRAGLPKPLPVVSPTAPRNVTELMTRIAEIRRTGYSAASDEWLPGVGSLGFAVSSRDTNETIGVALRSAACARCSGCRTCCRSGLAAAVMSMPSPLKLARSASATA
jgi:DNA-binding IclR family transcriptional regulator